MTLKTQIDYFKFRTLSGPFEALEALKPAFGSASDLVQLGPQIKGREGWEFRRNVVLAGDMNLGIVDYGGDSQRGWVRFDFTGSGCGWVQDWRHVETLPALLDKPTIRRLDIALTTYEGEIDHDRVIAAHDAKLFGTGGRHPFRRVITSDDQWAGRTVYVGRREGAKFLRCYEKGLEMISKGVAAGVPKSATLRAQFDHHGWADPFKVYRVEVELKPVDDQVVPWSACYTERDSVFAGSYPWLASLLPSAKPVQCERLPEVAPKVALASALENCRRSYGAIIRAALQAYGGDEARVLRAIASEEPARALIEAGILTVDHTPKGARETV
jgi:DNA relaxase NicK